MTFIVDPIWNITDSIPEILLKRNVANAPFDGA